MPAGLSFARAGDAYMDELERKANAPRLTQREAEMLVEDLLVAYYDTLGVDDHDGVTSDMSASEEARFIHDWAAKFVKAEP